MKQASLKPHLMRPVAVESSAEPGGGSCDGPCDMLAQLPTMAGPRDDSPGVVASAHVDAPSITTESLGLAYGGSPAFEGVSLTIKPNRVTALIGPSGSGKTSFLMCINRLTDLIPTCCVTGGLLLGATDVLAPRTDVTTLRRRVGMIFQKPNPFPLSIRRNIELPLREHGMRKRTQLDQAVETALRDVGLWDEVKDRLGASAMSLSGGQQQRLCIARAVALRPEVLLFDEPCSALDPIAGAVIENLITAMRRRYTLVVVTHNLAQAARIADDAAVFWNCQGRGCLIESGPAKQVFECPSQPVTAQYLSGHMG
jgi:phosphate transport system ATP-binding protein